MIYNYHLFKRRACLHVDVYVSVSLCVAHACMGQEVPKRESGPLELNLHDVHNQMVGPGN